MRKRFRSFAGNEHGGVLILSAFAFPVAILAIGIALDYSRATTLKTRLQDAVDAAVLVAAKAAPAMNDKDLLDATTKVFKANAGDPTAKIDALKVTNGRRKVELTVSALSKSAFGGVVGMSSMPVGAFAASVTSDNAYEIALVIDNSGSMASSAGGKSKMQSAKDAANKLIDSMLGAGAGSKTKFSIVPFTLTANVGSQYATAAWMDTKGVSSIHWENFDRSSTTVTTTTGKGKKKRTTTSTVPAWQPTSRFEIFNALGVGWAGCPETRPGNWATSDAAPTASDPDSYFVPMLAPDEPGESGESSYSFSKTDYWYPNSYLDDNPGTECKNDITQISDVEGAFTKICKYQNKSSLTTASGRGPNYSCNAKPLLRLTSAAPQLHSAVDAMAASGNTNLFEGFMWGWRTISPNAPFADGKPYKTVDNQKIVILLTDGMNVWGSAPNHNQSIYSPFGYYTDGRLTDPGKSDPTNQTEARAQIDAKTLAGCTNAKAQGVIVYTVGFSVSTDPIDAAGLDLLKKCASSSQHAFVANDSSAIVAVFDEIGRSIGGLRLTQ